MNQPQAIESKRNSTQENIPALAESSRSDLPVAYQTAKQAIAICESTDECRTWADKHAALAAYAKMRDDRDLHNYALRIQLRAERRWGELDRELYPDRRQENLRQAPSTPAKSAETKTPEFLQNSRKVADRLSGAGPRPPAADGTTEFQRKTARRLAAIPEESFERQIESPVPPTKTQLAEQGIAKRPQVYVPDDISPAPLEHALRAQARLREFAALCGITDPAAVARACVTLDVNAIRGYIDTIDGWLDKFVVTLPAGSDESEAF